MRQLKWKHSQVKKNDFYLIFLEGQRLEEIEGRGQEPIRDC